MFGNGRTTLIIKHHCRQGELEVLAVAGDLAHHNYPVMVVLHRIETGQFKREFTRRGQILRRSTIAITGVFSPFKINLYLRIPFHVYKITFENYALIRFKDKVPMDYAGYQVRSRGSACRRRR